MILSFIKYQELDSPCQQPAEVQVPDLRQSWPQNSEHAEKNPAVSLSRNNHLTSITSSFPNHWLFHGLQVMSKVMHWKWLLVTSTRGEIQVGFLNGKGRAATVSPPNTLLPPHSCCPQATSWFILQLTCQITAMAAGICEGRTNFSSLKMDCLKPIKEYSKIPMETYTWKNKYFLLKLFKTAHRSSIC